MEGLFDDLPIRRRQQAGHMPQRLIQGRLDRHEPIHEHRVFIGPCDATLPGREPVHPGKIQPAAVVHDSTISARNRETQHRDGAIETDHPIGE